MKQIIYTLTIILIIGLIVGCNPYSEETMVEEKDIEQEENKPVEKEPKEEIKEDPIVEQKPVEKPIEQPIEQPKQELDSEIAALIQKNIDSTNYGYTFESSTRDSSGFLKITKGYQVKRVDDKIIKILPNLVRVKNISYDEIYVDQDKKTAYGVCMVSRSRCELNYLLAHKLDYAKEEIGITPIDVLKGIPNDAKIVGDEMYDNRKVTIIGYTNEKGLMEKVYVDSYYGIPMRQSVFKIVNGEEVKTSENTFTRLVVGNIKANEVMIGSDITVPK